MKFLTAIIFIFVLNINHVLSDNLYDALKIAYKNNKELNAERAVSYTHLRAHET